MALTRAPLLTQMLAKRMIYLLALYLTLMLGLQHWG